MSEQERQLQDLESRFPLASGEAFAAARAEVLASGQSVLQTEGGFIVRVFPDGRKQRLKAVEAPTPVTPGTTFTSGDRRHPHAGGLCLAYIFDNATDSADPKRAWIAEISDGQRLELKTDRIPTSFYRAVMEKIV